MKLDAAEVHTYRERGLLVLQDVFDASEVQTLRDAFERDSSIPGPQRVVEDGGKEVRAVYASHQRQPEFTALVRSPRILEPVRQLLDSDVYIYQFKINAKPAFAGGGWAWHQDYLAWKLADNLPAPSLVNVGVLFDDVNEFNGPVIFVPGSHRQGLVKDATGGSGAKSEQHLDPDDIALTPSELAQLADQCGMESAKGKAGSVVFFDPQIVHGSSANISPFPRRLLIVTYNDVRNEPQPLGEPRPDYLVGKDTTRLEVAETSLVQASDRG